MGWLAATLLFSSQTQAAPLVLATKSFTEQHILSAMTVQYLQKKGFQVQPQTNIAAVISRNAMVNKQIDITWEYTGTSLIIFNRIDKRMSPQETYDTVKRLDAKLGLVWLKPADMNNTYAFAMQRKRAESEISPPSRKWWQKSNKSGRTILTTTGCSASIWNLPGAATG